MGIVGREKPRPFWRNTPMYKLRNCECSGNQHERDIYFIYVGPGQLDGFWVVKCRRCGKVVKGRTQEEAARNWNGEKELERYCD